MSDICGSSSAGIARGNRNTHQVLSKNCHSLRGKRTSSVEQLLQRRAKQVHHEDVVEMQPTTAMDAGDASYRGCQNRTPVYLGDKLVDIGVGSPVKGGAICVENIAICQSTVLLVQGSESELAVLDLKEMNDEELDTDRFLQQFPQPTSDPIVIGPSAWRD
jgi:hypothetical protein